MPSPTSRLGLKGRAWPSMFVNANCGLQWATRRQGVGASPAWAECELELQIEGSFATHTARMYFAHFRRVASS